MPTVISLKGVSCYIEGKRILRKIDWNVEEGQHYVLFGKNGSGKTTLLRLISGYLYPSEGSINILGKNYRETDLRELRKEIGLVSSSLDPLLHGEDTALEIVISGNYAATRMWSPAKKEDRRRAEKVMKVLRCSDLKDKLFRQLSQGEKQKVLIARSLMPQPKLLILDEPFLGLDIATREKLMKELYALEKLRSPPTIILVTHHVEEIMPFFRDILILKAGRVFLDGKIQDILTPRNLSNALDMRTELRKSGKRYSVRYF